MTRIDTGMPPKSTQKGSPKKPTAAEGAVVDKNWEAGLIKAPFEEDSWQACVCWVVGSSPADEELVQALANAFRRPQYKLFTSLTWDGTLAKIHELGNPKTKKSDLPLYYEVTAAAKVLLDAGEAIPCDLMAKILKCLLLAVKANDQKRREAENAKASALSASRERGGVKKASPLEATKEKTKLKQRKDVDSPVFKDEEPDDGPQHYILVLGFYQPQLIEALDALGVRVANVIKLCSEPSQSSAVQQEQATAEGNEQSRRASPVLDADSDREKAAQVRKLDLFWSLLRPVLDSAPLDSELHSVAQLSYTVPDVLPAIHTQDPEAVLELGSQILEGVASLIFDSLDWRRQHQHYLDNLKLINVPAVVRLDFQPLEDVPTPLSSAPLSQHFKKKSAQEEVLPQQDSKLHPLSTHVDMRYYSNLLDLVPPEAYSVPIILHCILEQVVVSTEQSVSEKPGPHGGPWLDQQLVSYMLQNFLPLVHTEEEKELMLNSLVATVHKEEEQKRLVQKFGAQVTRKKLGHPVVIRHHDERAVRLKDISAVEGFDPAEVELSMMRLSPVWGLIQSVARQRSRNSCWMAIKQQLQHYCTDDVVSWPEVERLFHQSVFESMPLTRLDQNGVLMKTAGSLGTPEPAHQQIPSAIPWDNPLSYAKQQLRNLQTEGPTFLTDDPTNTEHFSERVHSHLDLNDIQSCRLRNLFDWHYAEHHDSSVFPQVLQLASEEYCCLDTFRGSHNNILYIFCHNPMGSQCHSKEFWDVTLHTNVKFRKYLEHVADTIGEWTREEELKREEMELRNLIPAGSPEDEMASNASEEENALEPVIRKDSLKAWKLEQDRLKEDEMGKKFKKETGLKVKQPSEEDKLTEKSKTLSGSLAKTESITTTVEDKNELQQTEEHTKKGFTGYDMDGRLIHVSGGVQRLLPSDGGHVTVENISYVEGSSIMKVALNKDGHNFYTHINHVVDPVKPPPQFQNNDTSEKKKDCKESESVRMTREKQGSLSAVLDNGVRLSYSFYGPTGRLSPKPAERGIPETCILVPIPPPSPTHPSKGEELEPASSKTLTPASQATVCEGQPFNCLNLSVPNGLLLQFLRENATEVSTEEQSMLVRQSFSFQGGEEVMQLQDPSLSKELSRIITSQGTVIRYMRDGSTEVLFADGSVSFSQDCGPVWVPDSEVDMASQEAEDNKKENSSQKGAQGGCWSTTTPSGARICTVGTTHKYIPTTPLLTFKATDPVTHEVMLSREDLVVSVQNLDGSLSVEHADGTRITSLYKDRQPHAYVLPHAGDQSESATLKSTPECVCGYTECVCVPRCADTINEKSHIQGTPDSGDEISGDSVEEGRDKEDAGPARAMSSERERVCQEQQRAESRSCKIGEESVFAEETVAEINERNSRESEEGSVSAKERVVVVEKEGCATVVMYPGQHMVHAFLADGTVITGNNQGAYQVFPSSVGLLQIQSDGRCVYSSDSLVTPSPMDGSPTNPPGSYTFSHSDKVACDITDPDGNHFQVMEDGQISVLNFSPAPSTLKSDEEDEEESKGDQEESPDLQVKFREHCPRLFLVHEDGSGTELLSSQNVEELLYQAYNDPATALLKEPLPHAQDEFGITILKPSHQSVWSQWVLSKQNPDITPPNLRNHSWLDYTRAETNIPAPQFGTVMGPGRNLRDGSLGFTAQRQPVRSCPKFLEMRELYQHQPFSTPLRNTIDMRLKEYIEVLMEREQRSEEREVKDPRSEEESAHASNLLSMVLSFAEEEDADRIFDRRTSVDIASLYSKGVGAEQPDVLEDAATADSDSFVNRKGSKWTERVAQHRQQMCDEKACRAALRNKTIVSYFHTENTPLYQSLLQQQTPDMRALSMDLPPFPKSDSFEAFLKDGPQEDAPRPSNPTPSTSASRAARSDSMPEKRPTNPTPGDSSLRDSYVPCKSVQVDVTGKPRRTKVRLPTSILSSKPRSVPNHQFLSLEEPVRRKCRTISLTDPNVVVRGFHLLPSRVDFGTLQEGTSSAITVVMKNVGVDTCRFYVKQPPPATGLRVIYVPGPVAAGLLVELQVQLFAMCAGQTGEVQARTCISQDIIIHTETDILYLPVTATVLPERSYDIWLKDQASAHKKKSSRTGTRSSSQYR